MSLDQVVQNTDVKAPGRRGLELRKPPVIVVGGLPTVSLLPGELRDAARGRTVRRALIAGVAVAVIVMGGLTAGATALSGMAQTRLDAANANTQTLINQLGKFRDVQALQQNIVLGNAAVKVGASTEIDWQAQLDAVQAEMPAGYTITGVQADSASAVLDYPQGTGPLDQPRAASLLITVATSDITRLPPWLRKLRSIPAYADMTASVNAEDDNAYVVQLVLHLSPKALTSAGKAAK
jgi:hypothetical protein